MGDGQASIIGELQKAKELEGGGGGGSEWVERG